LNAETETMSQPRFQAAARRPRAAGFSLIEVMVALTLGLLLSIGILSLFSNSSSMNRTQEGLARLQENGRYAVGRIMDDLRSGLSQPLSMEINSKKQIRTANGAIVPPLAADVYVANLQNFLPRWGGGTIVPNGWPANTPYPLSPRWFLQGHECAVGSATCTPTVPTWLPAVGTAAGSRVRGTDVLTTRNLSSPGWSLTRTGSAMACAGNVLNGVAVQPLLNEPATNFVANDIAMIWSGNAGLVFQVAVAGGAGSNQALVPINVLGGSVPCLAAGAQNAPTLYNLSRDLRTITYFVQLVADPNPDATTNRLIPTLMRWVEGAPLNTRAAEVVASGVERLDFMYGIEDRAGLLRFIGADTVLTSSSPTTCTNAPVQYESLAVVADQFEPGCLWRSVRNIEAHLQVNTINDQFTLSPADMAYRYSVNGTTVAYTTPAPPGATLPNGLAAGRMLRREFTVQVSLRNNLP
jgi:type IV pilus assembly protein PilW